MDYIIDLKIGRQMVDLNLCNIILRFSVFLKSVKLIYQRDTVLRTSIL